MAHRFEQSTGKWFNREGRLLAVGFSGYDPDPTRKGEEGEGVNDPSKEGVKNTGPLPRGRYRICAPEQHPHVGPFAMRLSPLEGDMKGRGGFYIHGDSKAKPGTGSHGCIILPRVVRESIWASGDRELVVVAGPTPEQPKEVA